MTADGVVRTASPTEHSELLWAARGAGRGLGVVAAVGVARQHRLEVAIRGGGHQIANGGVYVNFSGFNDETDVSTPDTLGNQARLAEIRALYDPDGVFAAARDRR